MAGLTDKQQAFVKEYIIDFNATKAASRAGYSNKTARSIGTENLSKPVIQDAIAKEIEKRNERVEVNADYVLKKLVDIIEADMSDILNEDGSIKPISEWPPVFRKFVHNIEVAELWENTGDVKEQTGLIKKIKWPEKLKALEILGKHVDVQAFREQSKVEKNVTGEVHHTVTDMTESERLQRIAELQKKLGQNDAQ